jgi:serine/threonine protein kinase
MKIDGKLMPTSLPPEIYRDKAFAEKYLIERELGVGGAGIVVRARHRELDEPVAIKFLLPGQTQEAVARFRREARAASRIKNQHVVRILDVATTDAGVPYIVMEYLDGLDLERMLQQRPNRQLLILDAIEFILQACEALAECHGLGIVHRDLKPSNLFCVHGADGLPMIKVLDFGISKLMASTAETDATDHSRILGSPRYMSPEQFDNAIDVDNRTDIWAIGVILYELVTGVVPFVETDVLRLWQKIRSDQPVSVASRRPEVLADLEAVILKCLEKDRVNRFSNLAEFAKALLPFAPQRAWASVARIVRIVESPGTMTSALDLPQRTSGRWSQAPTIHSITPERVVPVKPRFPVGAAVLAVLAAVIVFWPRGDAGHVVATAGTTLASAPDAQVASTPPPSAAPAAFMAVSEPIATADADAGKPPAASTNRKSVVSRKTISNTPDAGPSAPWLASSSPPTAQPPVATAQVATPTPGVAAQPAPSPWIVDIVEQRKPAP